MDLDEIHELASEPEYASVEAFVQYCMDDERDSFTHVELRALALNARRSGSKIREELESFGMVLAHREPSRRTRGFTTSSLDRWYGPGACKTHGGSGYEQILGFAGRKG